MRKVAIALAVAAGMVVVTNPGPASATPTGCSAFPYNPSPGTEGAAARCLGGSGQFRAVALCTDEPHGVPRGTYPSDWETAGAGSRAIVLCPPGAKYVKSAKFELKPAW
ncbi:hypothetical protein FE391_26360 [Nonomuraea sp. KC401]|uniref:hypothetical protein n=1 Tax=unclassified Nonomuraea TaxID=2593643 RepID=UPI0010FE8B3C|nr:MULTISPECIES: hypothetical protein [unclassified Nonomuraea]NBE94078.1 hypothetical protein [Nonomuraea sp. K271]TLF65126.1 hypothetical protein FE391_26360 [Nonomuraea sp. KC401]